MYCEWMNELIDRQSCLVKERKKENGHRHVVSGLCFVCFGYQVVESVSTHCRCGDTNSKLSLSLSLSLSFSLSQTHTHARTHARTHPPPPTHTHPHPPTHTHTHTHTHKQVWQDFISFGWRLQPQQVLIRLRFHKQLDRVTFETPHPPHSHTAESEVYWRTEKDKTGTKEEEINKKNINI